MTTNTTATPRDLGPDHVADYANAFAAGRRLGSSKREDCGALDPVRRRAELFGALGLALIARPYGERRAILDHLAPALTKEGLPLSAIEHFDPTDAALQASLERARALGAAFQAGEGA